MTHAERCPICYGTGKVNDPTNHQLKMTCYGCGGKGWIEVNDQPYISPPYQPYNPYPWYPTYYPYCPAQHGGWCDNSCVYCPYRVTWQVTYNGHWDSTKNQWVDEKTTIHWHSDGTRYYD